LTRSGLPIHPGLKTPGYDSEVPEGTEPDGWPKNGRALSIAVKWVAFAWSYVDLRRLSAGRGGETVLVRHVGREVAVGPIQYAEGEAWAKPHHGIEKEERSKKLGSVVLLIVESVFRHFASAFQMSASLVLIRGGPTATHFGVRWFSFPVWMVASSEQRTGTKGDMARFFSFPHDGANPRLHHALDECAGPFICVRRPYHSVRTPTDQARPII
jgi:hypothetical protein